MLLYSRIRRLSTTHYCIDGRISVDRVLFSSFFLPSFFFYYYYFSSSSGYRSRGVVRGGEMGLEPVVDDDRERGKEESMKKMEQYATMCLSGGVCL